MNNTTILIINKNVLSDITTCIKQELNFNLENWTIFAFVYFLDGIT